MSGALMFTPDLLKQAQQVGGEINSDFDRQAGTSESLPIYSVVGRNSKDSSYRGVLEGKSVEVSRAGSFRFKKLDGEPDYYDHLDLVIVDARTAWTLFEDNKVLARGISTRGLANSVWIDGNQPIGASCEASPYCRWTWEKMGGKEGRVTADGKVLTREDLATCSLQLWCYTPDEDGYCIVQFSSGAIKHYREAARGVEAQSVKIHSILWRITTEPVDNGASAAPSYVPVLTPLRVLSDQEFAKVDAKRSELVVKAASLATPKLDAIPASATRALSQASAFSSPPLANKGPAEADPNDVFADVD